jgi:hypothetical protein
MPRIASCELSVACCVRVACCVLHVACCTYVVLVARCMPYDAGCKLGSARRMLRVNASHILNAPPACCNRRHAIHCGAGACMLYVRVARCILCYMLHASVAIYDVKPTARVLHRSTICNAPALRQSQPAHCITGTAARTAHADRLQRHQERTPAGCT